MSLGLFTSTRHFWKPSTTFWQASGCIFDHSSGQNWCSSTNFAYLTQTCFFSTFHRFLMWYNFGEGNDKINCTPKDYQWLWCFLDISWLMLFNNLFTELFEVLLCLHGVVIVRSTDSSVTGPSRYRCLCITIIETHLLTSDDLHFTNSVTYNTIWLHVLN